MTALLATPPLLAQERTLKDCAPGEAPGPSETWRCAPPTPQQPTSEPDLPWDIDTRLHMAVGLNVLALWGQESAHDEVGTAGILFRIGADFDDHLRLLFHMRQGVLANTERITDSSRSLIAFGVIISPMTTLAQRDDQRITLRPELGGAAECVSLSNDAAACWPSVEIGVGLGLEMFDDDQTSALELRVSQSWLIGSEDAVLGLGPIHNISLSYTTSIGFF